MHIPPQPTVYEINTATWLYSLRPAGGRPRVTLGTVPSQEWDRLAERGIDAVWLMGVWQRSAVGKELAWNNASLREEMRSVLPDVRPEDVLGSPYCIRSYAVDPLFGGNEGLARARRELADRGIALILDYVPNHVAPDHPWVARRPDFFIRATEADLIRNPDDVWTNGVSVFARAKDPFFPPWTDVLQLNAFSPDLRRGSASVLSGIANQCDGVRCDMAMLMCTDVFSRTWGERAGLAPGTEFWQEVIPQVRAAHPEFTMIAEVYWGMEEDLFEQGFDYCYDKEFYDYVLARDSRALRTHLTSWANHERALRFLENHDEERAAIAYGSDRRLRLAHLMMETIPSARLYHAGQCDGLRTRIPVFLQRAPQEEGNPRMRAFCGSLTVAVARTGLREARWQLCNVTAAPDSHLLAWQWEGSAGHYVVVVNVGDSVERGYVPLGTYGGAGVSSVRSVMKGDDDVGGAVVQVCGDGLDVAVPPEDYGFLSVC